MAKQKKTYSNTAQTLFDVYKVLMQYSSKEKPLSISQIRKILLGNLKDAPSVSTINRALEHKGGIISSVYPQYVLREKGEPGILQFYFEDQTFHVVVEDRFGHIFADGDWNVIVEKDERNPASVDSVSDILTNLNQGKITDLPFRVRCVVKDDGKYVPYDDLEEGFERETDFADAKRKYYYYLEGRLTDAEWKILYDLVQVYPYISEAQTQRFLEMLKKISPKSATGLPSNRYAFKHGSDNQFKIIEKLDSAIRNTQVVKLVYGEYRLEKNNNGMYRPALKKRRGNRGDIIICPYALMWSNGYYYLIGKVEEEEELFNLRVDRIIKADVLSDKTFKKDPNFNPIVFRDRSPVMYPGKHKEIRFRCDVSMVNVVQDFFGEPAIYSAPKGNTVEVRLVIAPEGFKLFALQYMDKVEVLAPASLRDEIIRSLQESLDKYSV